ncbi:hypothetical protein Peur_056521 [Populus x canadensis]
MPGKVLARYLPISALVCIEQPIFSASSRQCAFVSAPAPRPLTKGFILSFPTSWPSSSALAFSG